jgi:putative oxidoreductase
MEKNVLSTHLYLPFLAPIHARLEPLAWPLVRITAGLIMIPHGIPKIFGTFAPVLAKNVLAPLGLPAPLYLAYFLGTLEILGGVLLAVGFMTRLLALMFAIETAVILYFVSLPKGWIYSVPGGGAEFPALLMILFVALVFKGAGPYSLDSACRREI